MRKFIRRIPTRPPIALIILPMIDIIFLLLLFFVVMTSFEAGARIRVEIPEPQDSRAARLSTVQPVIINCEITDPESPTPGAMYRISADEPESLADISNRLAAAKTVNPALTVVIRADRRLPFLHVRAVVKAVADNGIDVLNVSALRETKGGS